MTENLKSCPFCNAEAELHFSEGESGKRYFWVSCKKCSCSQTLFDTPQEAISAWNNRPIEDEKDKENKRLREALEFYAHGKHLWDADERDPACDSYDIVSGQVENGKYAMEVLEGNEND